MQHQHGPAVTRRWTDGTVRRSALRRSSSGPTCGDGGVPVSRCTRSRGRSAGARARSHGSRRGARRLRAGRGPPPRAAGARARRAGGLHLARGGDGRLAVASARRGAGRRRAPGWRVGQSVRSRATAGAGATRALRADERVLAPGPAPQALQAGARAAAARAGRRQARRAVVPGTSISGWLARTYAGEQALQVSTAERSPQPLRADARRARQGAHRPAAHAAHHAPLEAGGAARAGAASSGTGCPSARARPRSRTAPCPATGRATCWPAHRTRTSPPWSSARPASCSSSSSTAGTARRWSPPWLRRCRRSRCSCAGASPGTAARSCAAHQRFSIATDVAVDHACDPRSPWQRGTNENTNGLLRQYFPKQTDLAVHTQAELDAVAARLNGRPRKTLAFETSGC